MNHQRYYSFKETETSCVYLYLIDVLPQICAPIRYKGASMLWNINVDLRFGGMFGMEISQMELVSNMVRFSRSFVFEFESSLADKLTVTKTASRTFSKGTPYTAALSAAIGGVVGVARSMVAGPVVGVAAGIGVAAYAGVYSTAMVADASAIVWVAGGVGWVASKCIDITSPFVLKLISKLFTSSYEAQVKYAVQELRLWNRNGILWGDDYSEDALVELGMFLVNLPFQSQSRHRI